MIEYRRLTVPGKPIGKGRPRFSNAGPFPRAYTPQKTVEFENLVRLAWIQSGQEMLTGNIRADIKAVFPIPSSVSKKKAAELRNTPYPKKPDADNIAKAVLDSLNGLAFGDDATVTMLVVEKRYGDEPRTEIVLSTSEEAYNVEN